MSRTIINGTYGIEYLPTQKKVIDSMISAQHCGFPVNIMLCGGFGSGKTRPLGEFGFDFGVAAPKIEVGYFRKSRVSIVDTLYKDFIDDVVPPEYIKTHNKSRLELTLTNGSYYHFFGIDNFQKKGSLQFDIVIVDEGIELEEEDYRMLEGRLRGRVLKHPLLIVGTNAGAPESYLYNEYPKNEGLPADQRNRYNKYFVANSFENIHNPKSYFDRLERWKGTQYYDRFILSLWKMFRGSIYEEFNSKKHVIPPFEIPSQWLKYIAVDFGFDHPLVINWYAIDPLTQRVYCYRQYYMSHVLLRTAIAMAKEITENNNEHVEIIWADHDAENRAQFEEGWTVTEPARKEVRAGIQTVGEYLQDNPNDKKPMFQIFNNAWSKKDCKYGLFMVDLILEEEKKPTCLQEEIPLYKWGKDDKPEKKNDHGCDNMRYMLHSHKNQIMQCTIFEAIQQSTYSRR